MLVFMSNIHNNLEFNFAFHSNLLGLEVIKISNQYETFFETSNFFIIVKWYHYIEFVFLKHDE